MRPALKDELVVLRLLDPATMSPESTPQLLTPTQDVPLGSPPGDSTANKGSVEEKSLLVLLVAR